MTGARNSTLSNISIAKNFLSQKVSGVLKVSSITTLSTPSKMLTKAKMASVFKILGTFLFSMGSIGKHLDSVD